MGIEQAEALISTRNEEDANRLLMAGWTQLLMADRYEGEHQWLVYQLAWQREDVPVEIKFTGVVTGPEAF